ncbi:hypothetical protein RKE30_23020 [Streptomyces sp. Li-HN-5-11]|uniref:hypothetical protein n=1 Tax=Streptomyces sp. Li-HN-5-11 TaxID=3075432 RepID=UPI0028AFE745|nr:hypothetical protein [Streptomyces sp. Li-HN-5-11]WNM33053.1 hypothetical protein RKE30_23020 [Streptomyces sp. Li-HN-5-11]
MSRQTRRTRTIRRTGRCAPAASVAPVLLSPVADPARIASAAAHTSMRLGAPGASAAVPASFPHRAGTTGPHGPALVALAGSVPVLASTLPDRSPGSLGSPGSPTPRKA